MTEFDGAATSPLPSRSADEVLLAFWTLIQVTNRHLKPAIEERQGLPLRLGITLFYIRKGAVYPGLLTEWMELTPSAVTRIVEDLVQRGLVQRGLDAEDSRRVRLSLTEHGHETLMGIRDAALDLWQWGLQGLSETEITTFLMLIRRVQDSMERRVRPA